VALAVGGRSGARILSAIISGARPARGELRDLADARFQRRRRDAPVTESFGGGVTVRSDQVNRDPTVQAFEPDVAILAVGRSA
jgi:hypothetical protein